MIKKIILSQNGNEEATEEIFKFYHRLILDVARPFYLTGGDRDDLLQEAYIGFFKALKAYKSDKGILFSTFAALCIQRQLITAFKKYNSNRQVVLNATLKNEYCISDFEHILFYRNPSFELNSPEDIFFEKNLIDLLKKFLNKNLSEIEKKVYTYIQLGYSYKEIGLLLDKSSKSIDNTMQRIRRKVLKYLNSIVS